MFITILIGYGSMMGNSQAISEILFKRLNKNFPDIDLKELNDVEIKDLNQYNYVIVILSTTGSGEQPDNSRFFYRKLRKYRENIDTNYAILGLGSSDYNSFCHASKCVDRIFKKLQIKSFMDIEFADDATGIEDVVDPWLDKVVFYFDSLNFPGLNFLIKLKNLIKK